MAKQLCAGRVRRPPVPSTGRLTRKGFWESARG